MPSSFVLPVDLVVLFDANMSPVPSCAPGCITNERILCRHRFGLTTRVISQRKPLKRPGFSDLEVLRYLIKLATYGIRGATTAETHWVIITKDWRFCSSAEHQYRSWAGRDRLQLAFGHNCVAAVIRDEPLHVQIVHVPGKNSSVENDMLRAMNRLRMFIASHAPL